MVWKAMLLLRQITELVCAHCITLDQVSVMSFKIDEYFELRLKCFPDNPLLPKHHYLGHYPWLTLQFGPLIHMWTLRFESKHSYFKRIVQSCGNFINVTLTLANTHQLLQAYLQVTDFFPPELSYTREDNIVYSEEVIEALDNLNLSVSNYTFCKEIIYKGTSYKKSQIVVLGKDCFDLKLGRILVLFILNSKPLFCVKLCMG